MNEVHEIWVSWEIISAILVIALPALVAICKIVAKKTEDTQADDRFCAKVEGIVQKGMKLLSKKPKEETTNK